MVRFMLPGAVTMFACACLALPVRADGEPFYKAHVESFVESQVRPWLAKTEISGWLNACNAAYPISTRPNAAELDKQWAAEAAAGHGPLFDRVTTGDFADALRRFESSNAGVVTEIFVIDRRGFVCASAEATSDYWQADESKWLEIFSRSYKTEFIDAIERDDSAFVNQSQVSLPSRIPAADAASACWWSV